MQTASDDVTDAWDAQTIKAFFEAFRPLVERTVVSVLQRVESERQTFSEKMAYSEAEAAALLGIRRHVLRDARLRGEIAGRPMSMLHGMK